MERRRRLLERQLQNNLLRRQKQQYRSWNNNNQGMGIKGKNSLLFNDRIMLIKLKTDENDLVIVQTYMPTSGYKDEEVEEIYEQLEEEMENVRKNDNLIILGDWNTVVGERQEGDAVGKCGLRVRNNRGKRLTDFSKENEFVITNTIFQQHRRR